MSNEPSLRQGRLDTLGSKGRNIAILAHLQLLQTDLERATVPPEELSAATAIVQHLISLCTADRFAMPVVLPALDSISYIAEAASQAAEIKAMVVAAHEADLPPLQPEVTNDALRTACAPSVANLA